MRFNLPIKSKKKILAFGAEFDTRLAFYRDGEIIFSENIGELAKDEAAYEKFALDFVETHCNASQKPDIIITDLHPLFNSRKIGARLAKKWNIPHIEVQHHIAHVFSAVADYALHNTKYEIQNTDFYGIACDGTGYGLDGNIWGGEVFKIDTTFPPPFQMGIKRDFSEDGGENRNLIEGSNFTHGKIPPAPLWERGESIRRIGHLEEQYLIGSELAIEEPARMLIGILSKFLSEGEIFQYVKKYYSAREFNLLWSQLEQKFNCPITTSAGRVLDAVSLLLGFCENERKYKHYPVKMLENFAVSGGNQPVKPKISKNKNGEYILETSHLFEYLIKNINLNKKELGYAAQKYIIEGLYEIAMIDRKISVSAFAGTATAGKNFSLAKNDVFFSGGLADNKVMKKIAEDNHIYVSKKIPSGDEGIAMGQIMRLSRLSKKYFYRASARVCDALASLN